jgi:hypothetical protein
VDSYSWFFAIGLLIVFHYGLKYGQVLVEKLTGRSSEVPQTNFSDLLGLIITLGIAFLPEMVMTKASVDTRYIFFGIGLLLGTLAKQALYGRKGLSNQSAASA